jgi:DNA-binding MarR family transcriptional regulator
MSAEASISQRIVSGLARISLLLRHHGWQSAAARSLTPTQAQILAVLASHAPRPLRLSALAELLALSLPTVSDAVTALEKKGMLRRRSDPGDGRAFLLDLTSRGRRAAHAASQWPDYLLAAVDELPAPRQEHLLAALMAMIRSLQEKGRIPVARMCTNCLYFEPERFPGSPAPHFCHFVQAPFGLSSFRLDCPDFQAAPEGAQRINQRVLISLTPCKGEPDGPNKHSRI